MESSPLDISGMTSKEIEALTDAELKPILRAGYEALFQEPMDDRDLAENLNAVRQGHWAPGIPTALGGGPDKGDTIGL